VAVDRATPKDEPGGGGGGRGRGGGGGGGFRSAAPANGRPYGAAMGYNGVTQQAAYHGGGGGYGGYGVGAPGGPAMGYNGCVHATLNPTSFVAREFLHQPPPGRARAFGARGSSLSGGPGGSRGRISICPLRTQRFPSHTHTHSHELNTGAPRRFGGGMMDMYGVQGGQQYAPMDPYGSGGGMAFAAAARYSAAAAPPQVSPPLTGGIGIPRPLEMSPRETRCLVSDAAASTSSSSSSSSSSSEAAATLTEREARCSWGGCRRTPLRATCATTLAPLARWRTFTSPRRRTRRSTAASVSSPSPGDRRWFGPESILKRSGWRGVRVEG
jgi:hypothetical protein